MTTPAKDHVAIRVEEVPDKTSGGIIIPSNAKDKPQRGTVVSIGAGELAVKPGDTVLYPAHSGTKIQAPEGELLIIREELLLAIII